MVMSRFLVPSLIRLSVQSSFANSEGGGDISGFSDDAVSLLQRAKRHRSEDVNAFPAAPLPYVILPDSDALHLVGRYSAEQSLGNNVIRFDNAGFEISFRVEGATEVKVALSQEITGPGGWYFEANPVPELEFVDGCLLSKRPGLLEDGARRSKSLSLNGTIFSSVSEGAKVAMMPQGSQPHHFLVYVDGVPQWDPLPGSRCIACTFDTTDAVAGQIMEYTVATDLVPGKSHHIRIVKSSEPDFSSNPAPVPNWIELHSVTLDSGHAQTPDPRRKHRIEFLGDSFMSGYCNTCDGYVCQGGSNNASSMGGDPPDTLRWGSYTLAWPHLLCEDLEAECHATVLSGMGMHCNTHPDGVNDCSSDQTLPMYWQRTLASDARTTWNFGSWTPEVFLLQAASNDHFYDPSRDRAAILGSYDGLFDKVFQTYPNVQVILVCGPFQPLWKPSSAATNALCPALKEVVQNRKESGTQLTLLDLTGLNSPHLKNCCGHPDADFHKIIKDFMVKAVKPLLRHHD